MLTLEEAAARLGVAASTLRWQIRNGKLHARKVGPVWVVTSREVERYQRENRRMNTTYIESYPSGKTYTACGVEHPSAGDPKHANHPHPKCSRHDGHDGKHMNRLGNQW